MAWTKTIDAEDVRRARLQSIFRDWLRKHPHFAMKAVEQFPREEQHEIFRN